MTHGKYSVGTNLFLRYLTKNKKGVKKQERGQNKKGVRSQHLTIPSH